MLIVTVVFLALLFVGMPVGFAIAISGVSYFFQHPEFPITTIVQLPITQTQNVTLLAVPLFIFAGHLMNVSGITTKLIELSMLLTGHMKGGLAQVSVVLSTFMGGVSGSSNADAAMEARILGPDMLKQGYSKGYTACVIGFTSLITSTIPPGVGMILYGTTGNVSIGRLFAAGLIVGIIMMIVYMIIVSLTAHALGYKPAREKRAGLREILRNLKESIWALIFPLILLICLRLGLFTPSEVGAMACVYALLVGVFIYRKITLKNIGKTLRLAVIDIGAIMLMISMSNIFGYGIPFDKIPQKVTTVILSLTSSPYVVMALIIIFLTILGMFMEGSIVIILTTPILLPVVLQYSVDPVVFGLIVSIVVTMGILTPPVGVAMYTVCGILDCRLSDYMKECWPFVLGVFAVAAIMVVFPEIVVYLPNLVFG
jgi:tripartite ATP-independent transporter DctM subunit